MALFFLFGFDINHPLLCPQVPLPCITNQTSSTQASDLKCYFLKNPWGFPNGSVAKNLPEVQEMWAQSLGWEDPLEKEMATQMIFFPSFHLIIFTQLACLLSRYFFPFKATLLCCLMKIRWNALIQRKNIHRLLYKRGGKKKNGYFITPFCGINLYMFPVKYFNLYVWYKCLCSRLIVLKSN